MKKTVLIIDDDLGIVDGLVTLLEDEGYLPVVAANGALALQYLNSHENPDLILLDLMMPVMDGYAFRKEQCQTPRLSEVPVVVMTAGTLTDRRAELNAAAYLRKPLDIDELLNAVQTYS